MTTREHIASIPLTADDPTAEASIGGLVRDATAHVSTLVRAEVELAKGEIAAEIKKGVRGGVFFIVALTILCFALFFLFMTLGFGFAQWFGWHTWGGFALVFVVMVLSAITFALLGYRKVKKIRAPEKSIAAAKDTVAALTRRGDDN
ncbi:Putative Holin-X, holin superfamily III [Lentzea albidocapillata subsp. violacea]|uniref:Putative Holin-X, holin superfamily III n=1 Tax=Lentzea albidocapillata subsp. violacea TaxID=128104 RepID=A0A1G9HHD1_9PSEU|nr:phage holin family protein [Lentzea albidocapillata]SDL12390.1 Putative Holin-X, holin superfamily III [Lentzea albidocapillata subsp. violacea]